MITRSVSHIPEVQARRLQNALTQRQGELEALRAISHGFTLLSDHAVVVAVLAAIVAAEDAVEAVRVAALPHDTAVQERANGALYVTCTCGWDCGWDTADEDMALDAGIAHEEAAHG